MSAPTDKIPIALKLAVKIISRLPESHRKFLLEELQKEGAKDRKVYYRVPLFEEAKLRDEKAVSFITNISEGGFFLESTGDLVVGDTL